MVLATMPLIPRISVGDRVVCTRGNPEWKGVYIVTSLPLFYESDGQFSLQSESDSQFFRCIKAFRREFAYAPAPEVAPQAEL